MVLFFLKVDDFFDLNFYFIGMWFGGEVKNKFMEIIFLEMGK